MDALRYWLAQELQQRGWSHAELARRSGISRPFISQVLSGDAKPSVNFCRKVAAALDESPDKLLRLAGILPPAGPATPEDDATLQELVELARNLPPEQRKEALRYIRYLYQDKA
ncbi:MAG: XRE family transcriptional regulator [Chloroflexi bacterium]|nr:MAG: XRE family transcriptional regulator [Chloroflexota bacterium]